MDKVEKLMNDLTSADTLTRVNAAYDLGQQRDKRAVEPLIQALKDSDKDMRYAAAEALGKIGDMRAKEPLTVALDDPDDAVGRAADNALGTLGTAGLLASSGRRFVNLVVDTIILIVLIRILFPFGAPVLWSVVIYFLYYFVFEAACQRSPAKFLSGTKVVTEEASKPYAKSIAIRTLCRFIPFELLSASRGTWWHDRWSRTRVVKA